MITIFATLLICLDYHTTSCLITTSHIYLFSSLISFYFHFSHFSSSLPMCNFTSHLFSFISLIITFHLHFFPKVLKKLSIQHLLLHMLPVVHSLKHVLETNNSHLQVCTTQSSSFIPGPRLISTHPYSRQ